MEKVKHTKANIKVRTWTRVKADHPAFMAFISDLEANHSTCPKDSCPNCSGRFGLADIKDFLKQRNNHGDDIAVGWNIECSNCLAKLEILNDK